MKRKIFAFVVSMLCVLTFTNVFSVQAARPREADLRINRQDVTLQAVNIEGYNFFRLRDLAYVLSGTGSQFDVGFDAATGTVSLYIGMPYQIVGGESDFLDIYGASISPSGHSIAVNGNLIRPRAFSIGGNNFFMLRDLEDVLGFQVDWDSSTNTIIIYTNTPEWIFDEILSFLQGNENDWDSFRLIDFNYRGIPEIVIIRGNEVIMYGFLNGVFAEFANLTEALGNIDAEINEILTLFRPDEYLEARILEALLD